MSCIESFYVFFPVVLLSFKTSPHRPSPQENTETLVHAVKLKKCFVGYDTGGERIATEFSPLSKLIL